MNAWSVEVMDTMYRVYGHWVYRCRGRTLGVCGYPDIEKEGVG